MLQPVLRAWGVQPVRAMRLLERLRRLGLFLSTVPIWSSLGGYTRGNGRCPQQCGVLQYGVLRRVRDASRMRRDYTYRILVRVESRKWSTPTGWCGPQIVRVFQRRVVGIGTIFIEEKLSIIIGLGGAILHGNTSSTSYFGMYSSSTSPLVRNTYSEER